MEVFIPTHGRASVTAQTTLAALVRAGVHPTLIVRPDALETYQKALGALARVRACAPVSGIADKRDWIIRYGGTDSVVIMLDDDLTFAMRREDDREKFLPATPDQVFMAVKAMESALLRGSAHVSLGAREGGNRRTDRFYHYGRMMRALGYRRDIVVDRYGLEFSAVRAMEDFHVTLSLLERGESCLTLNDWVTDQKDGSNAPGGCSEWRSSEIQAAAAVKLAALHPRYVKVVDKPPVGKWPARKDVIIQWKKAYEERIHA